jgi:uncharacterized protein (DUF488 family)
MLNRIYTIGHSTRTLDELVALLHEHGIARLADIRRYPGSRRHPHFSSESLAATLPLEYIHFEALGGRRRPLPDSRNGAWENAQFRGYADYMCTPDFRGAVDRLLDSERPTAVMCAEAVPWRCHRNLLSDDLVRRGIEVMHIVGAGSARPHMLSRMARIIGDCVTYPPEQAAMF